MTDVIYGPAEIAPVPIVEDATETTEAPKRRGRPPGSTNKPRDGSAPAARRGRPRGGKKSLENDIGGMLLMFNFIFGFLPQPWNGDAFTEQEIEALSKALDAFAQDHATVYKYLSTVLIGGGTSGIQLFLVVAQIANRRMENHGVTMGQLMGFDKPNGNGEQSASEI
jgi:hypothetical protein